MSASLDLSKLENVRQLSDRITARCPACKESGRDRAGAHLCIFPDGAFGCVLHPGEEGADHRKQILQLAGTQPVFTSNGHPRSRKNKWKTLPEASESISQRLGVQETARYIYRNASGTEIFAVFRFDKSDQKEYRPVYFDGSWWFVGDPPAPLILFELPDLHGRPGERVYVVEGEKCARELATLGFLVTTSAHGAKSANRTDWSPLAGRDVVILPDNDPEGRAYARTVLHTLHKLTPPASVRIVSLPELPVHGDAVDWLAARDAQTPEDLRSELIGLTQESSLEPAALEDASPITESLTFTVQVLADPDSRELRAKIFSLEQQKMSVSDKRKMMAGSLIEALHNRGRFFFHSELRDHKTALFFDSSRKLLLRLSDPAFVSWLALFTGVNRSENDFRFLHTAVEDEALQGKTAGIVPETLWAARPGVIYLSNGDGSIARISAEDVRLVDNGTDDVLFEQGATLPPWRLVEGFDPFESRLFRDANFAAPHGLDLVRLWTMSLPANHECKPPLVITGEIRSGKTLLVRGLFQLLGIPERIRQPIETDEGKRDFWIGANSGGLICLDNADSNIRWLADAIATASTAGGIERKKNYEDTARINLRAKAWIAITSANPAFGNDSGLADRLLVVRMNTRERTISESDLLSEITQRRDSGLSFLASHLMRTLRDDKPVRTDINKRHPDFATVAVRIGRSLGREEEAIKALSAAEDDKPRFCLENDSLGMSLITLIDQKPFEGTAADLLDQLINHGGLTADRWTPKGVGKKLSRLWPHITALYDAAVTERQGTKKYRLDLRNRGFVAL